MRIFLTGGTGLVGTRLVQCLLARNDQLVVLTRRPTVARQTLGPKVEIVEGDPTQAGPWMDRVESCEAVINLAGENIFARRWNPAFKQVLFDSRVKTTQHVAQAMLRQPLSSTGAPKVLVNASAIGIYGSRGSEELTEESVPGPSPLTDLCLRWEEAARSVAAAGIRSVQVRVGIVLDKNGGALSHLLPPFRLFVGGPVGSGKQYLSWIHHEDMVGLLLLALDKAACVGPLNATAPHPVTNSEFARALGKALGRPSLVWTPGFVLRLALGEVANVVLGSQRVLPKKALSLGYLFKFPTLESALNDLFR